jgi:hypothetical protein
MRKLCRGLGVKWIVEERVSFLQMCGRRGVEGKIAGFSTVLFGLVGSVMVGGWVRAEVTFIECAGWFVGPTRF